MVNFGPNIFLLLLSLWVHGLNAETAYVPCVKGFKRDSDKNAACAVSFTFYPYREQYSCVYSSCTYKGNHYTPMSNCRLIGPNGSPIGGVSDQKCTSYDYNEQLKNFACTNAANYSYACSYSPQTVPAMVCTDCNLG